MYLDDTWVSCASRFFCFLEAGYEEKIMWLSVWISSSKTMCTKFSIISREMDLEQQKFLEMHSNFSSSHLKHRGLGIGILN